MKFLISHLETSKASETHSSFWGQKSIELERSKYDYEKDIINNQG